MDDRMIAQAARTPLANTNPHKAVFWREWALPTLPGSLAVLAVLPAIWSVVEASAHPQGNSQPLFLTIQFLQSAAQVAALAAIGLFFAQRIGLGAPITEAYLAGDKEKKAIRSLLLQAMSWHLRCGGHDRPGLRHFSADIVLHFLWPMIH